MFIQVFSFLFIAITVQLSLAEIAWASEKTLPTTDHAKLSTTPAAETYDWVHFNDMTNKQKDRMNGTSCGAYIDPSEDNKNITLQLESAPLSINADATGPVSSDRSVTLRGDVQISQGNRLLKSDRAEINHQTHRVRLEGNVVFREPGLLLIGDTADIDTANHNLTIKEATYVIHDAAARGTAKTLYRSDEGDITIDQASYSTCEPGSSGWKLITKQININQETGWATVKNATFEVKDIPIFYFPYIKFPIDNRRSSGLLIPDINVNQENGLDISQPIYWNIAENYDATISPRYIQHRGFGLEAAFRYLNRWSESKISGAFLGNDKGGNNVEDFNSVTNRYSYQGKNRYKFNLSHQGGFDRNWSTFINYNRVSDLDYIRDLGDMAIEQTSKTHLKQYAEIGYTTDHWTYQVASQDYQVITQGLLDQYSVLPKISIDGHYRLSNNFIIDMQHQYAVFRHRDETKVEGNRRSINYGLAWNKRWNWGYVKPKVDLKHLSYDLNKNNSAGFMADSNPSISLPVYSLDAGAFFERDLVNNTQLKQTLEPRLFYLHSTYRDQSALPDFDTRAYTPSYNLLFRDTRFMGGDRIADDQRVTLGLTTRLLDKSSGQEKLRVSIAQSFYFRDRLIVLDTAPESLELELLKRDQSQIAMEIVARVNKKWHIASDIVYREASNLIEKTSLTARYNDRNKRLLNFTYRYTRRAARQYDGQLVEQSISQSNISAFLPISDNFNLVGRWNHDFTNDRELEVFAGFEYNNCCWRASLVAFRSLRRDDQLLFPEKELNARNGFAFKIEFKGLGGNGGRVDTMLNNGIFGYEHNDNF
jgi:LPS-assembly protein